MHEVEDAVSAGIHAGDEGGPSHGTLRRHGGSHALEIAAAPQPVEIRKRIPMAFKKAGVHGVDAEHDDFLVYRRSVAGAARERQANGEERSGDAS